MNMMGMAESQQRRPDRALRNFMDAMKLQPLPAMLESALTANAANAHFELRQMDRAEETARQAIAAINRTYGSEHPAAIFPQSTLAAVHSYRGDHDRAEPVLRRVLYLSKKHWGASSHEAAVAAGNLAFVYLQQHRYKQAEVHFSEYLAGLQSSAIRAGDEISLAQASLALSFAGRGQSRKQGNASARHWKRQTGI